MIIKKSDKRGDSYLKKIDFEAHFFTKNYLKALSQNKDFPRFTEGNQGQSHQLMHTSDLIQPYGQPLLTAILDLGERRLTKMDESGIDVQVLSLSAPGIEQLDPDVGTSLSKEANTALSKVTQKYPDRFLGFAALAPKAPEAAADELERAVRELGFVGWNTHSNFGNSYLDEERYLPILARAEKLGVPIYLHPAVPAMPQLRSYGFALAGPFGFTVDASMTIMRLIFSGVFDKHPGLTFILGHLGEALPFLIQRIDWAYVSPFDPSARPKLLKKPSDYLKSNVFVTTSGNYFEPAFLCTRAALGVDRILLGTDYPYNDSDQCIKFLEGLSISSEEKEKIYHRNAVRLGIENL